jgi:L-iditol 2-dehydrogenase
MYPKKRKAAVYYGKDDLRIEEIDVPKIKPNEVLIKIKAVGICGSDVHFYKEGRIGPYVPKPGHILGHEPAGVIVAVGENVKNRKVGDRVAIEPGIPCGECELCRKGKYNLCKEMLFMTHTNPYREGAFVEYVPQPAQFTYFLNDNVSFEEGAMAEPLSVAMQAIKNGNLKPGESVAILGSGPIGICMLLASRAAGASEVYNTDLDDTRVNCAKEFGATDAFNAKKEDIVERIMKATNNRGVDLVIETAGAAETYENATSLATRGGKIVFVGMSAETHFPINVFNIIDKELIVSSVFRYNNVYGAAVSLINNGLIPIKKIITHRFKLEDASKALNLAYMRDDNVIKAVVTF